jgi:putative ABC transport system permease protein
VLLFAAAAGAVASLAAGIFPAVQSARTDVNEVLKDESRGSSSLHIGRLSKGLVIVEIAFSCALLVAAGLMVKSVTRLRTMDPGFTTKTVFTARVGFPLVYTDTARQQRFFRQLAERVALLPGVQAAATSSGLPGAQQGLGGDRVALEGHTYARPQDYPQTRTLSVTPRFFETLNVPLSRGRLLAEQDGETAPAVAVVTQRFVDRFLKGEDPVGRRIRLSPTDSTQPWISIVGVVPNVFGGDPKDPMPPVIIRPLAQAHSNFVYISARTAAGPMALTQAVRTVAAELEPDLPLYWIMSLDQAIAQPLWFVRVFGTMFMIFGFIALFLAAVGLYAVMSFSVSRRTREIGIRMALGAEAVRVVRMIIRQGALQLAVGMAIGLAAALGVSSLMSVILFDVRPHDTLVFGSVAATLALAGLAASAVPALRATRVDPLTALRTE